MKEVTKRMIKDFKIMKLGVDFMGYEVKRENQLSFHHLIVPHRRCKLERVPFEGYVYWNGAILTQDIASSDSHDYLHLIEKYDYDRFLAITSEMIEENMKGYIDFDNLKYIDDILTSFEKEYSSARNDKGKVLIRDSYLKRKFK